MVQKKDLVRIKCSGDKLALVVKANEHTLQIRNFDKRLNKFARYIETVARCMVEPANLSIEEIAQIPCGKSVLTKNRALVLLATNQQFKDAKRREIRFYFCKRCDGYHTTSQPWTPPNIKLQIQEHPIEIEAVLVKGDIICQQTVFKWLRDVLGLRITQKWFRDSLKQYASTVRIALENIMSNPADYVEFYFEKRFIKNHALELN